MKLELKIVDFLASDGGEFTINELAKRIDEYYSFVYRTVNRMAKDGVIAKKKAGKAYMCSLKLTNEKSNALLKLAEIEKKEELYARSKHLKIILDDFIALIEKRNILSAVLFGSYSKGTQTKDSDIDILLLVKGSINIEKSVREIYAKYGKELSVVEMTVNEFKKQVGKPLIKEIKKNHHVIYNVEKFVGEAFE